MALWEKGRRSREEAGGEREEVWQWERCSEYFSFRCKLLENLRGGRFLAVDFFKDQIFDLTLIIRVQVVHMATWL